MKSAWAVADSVMSPLGDTTEDNFRRVVSGASGIKPLFASSAGDMVLAGAMDSLDEGDGMTTFENLCCGVLENLTAKTGMNTSRTLLILSTTKGNIDLATRGKSDHPRIALPATAQHIANRFGFGNHMIVSNACISGVLGIIVAKRLIQRGDFDEVVVLGADVLSDFVIAGFQSLLALSNEPCRPFDENRKGINLGEGAAAILLTSRPDSFSVGSEPVEVTGCAVSSDANHISGPSRTGEELASAVDRAMRLAEVKPQSLDFICAHGTATLYNDEMEAKAFGISGLSEVPLHSLKGYYGHTLGAAGVIETVMGITSLRQGILLPCLGYATPGVSRPLNVITSPERKPLNTFLKTSSGFGGCNAAIVLEKH